MSVLINLNTSANSLGGGADASDGVGEDWKVTIGGTWAVGDTYALSLTDSQTGILTQVGAGSITGINPTLCYTYNDKVYLLSEATAYFSAIGAPTTFNDPNGSGNGFITMSNFYATQQALTAIAPFQGRLLFTSRNYTQIWQVDPDPSNYALTQLLANIGTISPLSVQPIGDQDVYMCADNGFRSVQVRVASNNATISDVGVPIDQIVQPLLATLSDAQRATICGITEPSANRYMCYIPKADGTVGSIFVRSKFGEEIAAWSTYTPTVDTNLGSPNGSPFVYSGLTVGAFYYWFKGDGTQLVSGSTTLTASGSFTATATTATVTGGSSFTSVLYERKPFIPVKFEIYQGQVWVRDTNGKIYQYGGADNNTYSNCGISGTTPYLDSGKAATVKTYTGIDTGLQGTWDIGVSPDYVLQKYKSCYKNTLSSFKLQRIPVSMTATHYSISFEENGSGYARLSSLFMHLQQDYEK